MSQNCYFDKILSSAKIRWKTDSMCVLSVCVKCMCMAHDFSRNLFSNWREHVFRKYLRNQMRYSKNEICPEILRSLAFHIVLYKIHKKGHFECLICDQRYMVLKNGEIQPKSRVSEFSRTSLFYKSCRDVWNTCYSRFVFNYLEKQRRKHQNTPLPFMSPNSVLWRYLHE